MKNLVEITIQTVDSSERAVKLATEIRSRLVQLFGAVDINVPTTGAMKMSLESDSILYNGTVFELEPKPPTTPKPCGWDSVIADRAAR